LISLSGRDRRGPARRQAGGRRKDGGRAEPASSQAALENDRTQLERRFRVVRTACIAGDPELAVVNAQRPQKWRANKSFAAALVYKHEEVKNGSISTPNGTIGSASSTHKGDYNEVGLWTVYEF